MRVDSEVEQKYRRQAVSFPQTIDKENQVTTRVATAQGHRQLKPTAKILDRLQAKQPYKRTKSSESYHTVQASTLPKHESDKQLSIVELVLSGQQQEPKKLNQRTKSVELQFFQLHEDPNTS